jgi:hypothetical protein
LELTDERHSHGAVIFPGATRSPSSARLFTVPGKKAGEHAEFTDPLLCSSKVVSL